MDDNYGNDFVSATELMGDISKDVYEQEYQDDLSDFPVEVEIMNYEDEMEDDILSGNGFIITDKNGLDKSKTVRLENGIFSPKYGTIWGDENAFEELYSCKCGDLKAKMNRGKICPNCGEPVKFRDKNVHMTGWLKLDKYRLIHPNIYYKLCSLIGYRRMKAILKVEWETDITGNPIKPVIDDNSKNILKYDNIGILEFEKRFDEICKFFLHKKKDKKDAYDFIMKHRDLVFTSCFPVLPLFLRPIVLGEEDFNFDKVNRKYALLSAKFYNINDKHRDFDPKEEKILLNRLYSIQLNYFYTCDMIMDMMNKKEGLIRNDILGFRSNFSVRAVITPLSGTRINEIHFPYLGFLEMYRFEILNTLTKLSDITINEASMIWERAKIKFDKRVYACMQYIIDHTDCYILLNRNPTLQFGSIMRVKIVHVKDDYTDLTFSIPINILTAMGADFDGDQMNTYGLKDLYLKKSYGSHDPRENMIISKNDGLFDDSFNLIKDQMICFHQFNKLCNNGIEVLKPPIGKEEVYVPKEEPKGEKQKIKLVKVRRLK